MERTMLLLFMACVAFGVLGIACAVFDWNELFRVAFVATLIAGFASLGAAAYSVIKG